MSTARMFVEVSPDVNDAPLDQQEHTNAIVDDLPVALEHLSARPDRELLHRLHTLAQRNRGVESIGVSHVNFRSSGLNG